MRLRRFSAARLLALLAAAFFLTASTHARTLVFSSFSEQIEVNADGSIDVTELIDAKFTGKWNGIYRTIPVQYTTPQGFGYTLFLEPLSVTDDAGHALKYTQTSQGRYTKFQIWVPDAEDATRTVVLRYHVIDALHFYDDHDELYWNVTGDEWDAPIESAEAHIELPAGVTGLHAIAYTGVYGSRAQDAQVDVNGNQVEIRANDALGFHEGLTAVVGFDKGFVQPPSPMAKGWMFLRSNWPLFAPIVTFFVMLFLWWTRGRDPRRNAIAVQYDPPDNLTPGECGTLVDNSCEMRDVTATLVDLAVKGYLVIEQKQREGLSGLMHHNDYIFHLKKPPAEWTSLKSHEQLMLAGMFGSFAGESVSLSDMQNHFYIQLPGIRSGMIDALVQDGYYARSPDSVRQGYVGLGGILGFLGVFAGGFLAGATNTSQLAWTIAAIVSAAIICAFGWYMPAHTVKGVRTLEKVLGFEDFLGRVERDKIERVELTPDLFEKYLPYAMALRVDKKWVQRFSGIAMQPPQWYQGYYGSGFAPYLLVNDLNMMSMQAGSAMMSSPRSSGGLGGSGFGGGGGSGGGFGGGGGGGF